VRAVAEADLPPSRVLTRVRDVVSRNLSGGRFVTLFYAVLDRESGRLRFANAGHPPAMLLRAGGEIVRLGDGGPAIARALAELPYRDEEVAVAPGDAVLLFSDGASEARSATGELLGDDGLQALVRGIRGSEALLDTVSSGVHAFSGGRLRDDLTLLAVSLDA
jgi:phosphoserine phosphatase RsbU/P